MMDWSLYKKWKHASEENEKLIESTFHMSCGLDAGIERVYHIPLCSKEKPPWKYADPKEPFERQMALYDLLETYAKRDDFSAFSVTPSIIYLNPDEWDGSDRGGFESYETPVLSIIPHEPTLFRNVMKEISKDQQVQKLLAPLRDMRSVGR